MKLRILGVANKEGARAGNRFRPRFREERNEGRALGSDPKAPLRPRTDNNELGKPSGSEGLPSSFVRRTIA